jgi:hypothetical protein
LSSLLDNDVVIETTNEPSATGDRRFGPAGPAVFVGLSGLAMALIFLVVKGSLSDDAYITLAYAKNLALHFHWGLNPYEVSNSETSPLNVLLLGGISAVTRIFGGVHPVVALGILSVALVMIIAWSWTRIIAVMRLPMTVAVLGMAVILLNPILLSAIGLEVLLIPAVIMVMFAMAISGRPVLFGIAAGLAMITRADLVIFVVVIALASKGIRQRRSIGWAALTTLFVGLPWYIFSWFYFGSAVSDTLLIKTDQASFGQYTFMTGPLGFFMGRHIMTALAFGPAILGLVALLGWLALRFGIRRPASGSFPALGPAAGVGVGGVVYYAAYSMLGVPPYHWYYVPSTVSLATFGVVALGAWWAATRRQPLLRPGAPAVALGLVALIMLGNVGIEGEQGVPWRSPVIFGNWASAKDYARVGGELAAAVGDRTVRTPAEIGTLAYFCDCDIVNEFADPGVVAGLVNQRIKKAGRIGRLLLDINYHWYDFTRQPKQVEYVLNYGSGPGSGPDVWQVYSAAAGIGHLTLTPGH